MRIIGHNLRNILSIEEFSNERGSYGIFSGTCELWHNYHAVTCSVLQYESYYMIHII